MTEPTTTSARPDPMDEPLAGMPDAGTIHPGCDIGTLVRAWVRGYKTTHDGERPPLHDTRRVAGVMKSISRRCVTVEDWAEVEAAAEAAGAEGRMTMKDRITVPRRPRASDRRPFAATYASTCAWCGNRIDPGDLIGARKALGLGWSHVGCIRAADAAHDAEEGST